MNWDAIGAVAEALGSIGVLISLIYLAMQIRLNTRQIKTSIETDRLAAFERNVEAGNRVRELLILHPELAELFYRGNLDYDSLQGPEKMRYEFIVRNIFSSMQGTFVRQISIEHDPEGTAGLARIVESLLQNQGVRQVLSRHKPDWRPEFREFVQQRLDAVQGSGAADN